MGIIYRNKQPIDIPPDGRLNDYDKKISKYYQVDGKRRRWVIGTLASPGKMVPNDNFRRLYPHLWQQYYGEEEPADPLIRTGLYAATLGLCKQNGLYEVLQQSIGLQSANRIIDFSMFSIRYRSNTAQHYPIEMQEQLLFSREVLSDKTYSEFFKDDLTEANLHKFKVEWLKKCKENKAKNVWLCIDGSNNDCAVTDSDLAKFGHAKSGKETPIVGYIWAVNAETGRPITWFINNGSMPDCKAIDEIIRFLSDAKIGIRGVILDRGFASQEILDLITKKGLQYIVMLKTSSKGFQEMLARHANDVRWCVDNVVSDDGQFGITDQVHVFGTSTTKTCVGLFFSGLSSAYQSVKIIRKVRAAAAKIQAQLKKPPQEACVPPEVKKYLSIKELKDKTRVLEYNIEAWQQAVDNSGFYAIASSSPRSAQEILDLYKLRDISEKQFSIAKSQLGFDTTRGHTDPAVRGRLATAFVASIIRTEIVLACQQLSLDTNDMIRKLDNVYMLRMPSGSLEFIKNLSADLTKLLSCFGVTIPHLVKLAEEVNKSRKDPTIQLSRSLPSLEPAHRGRPLGSKNKSTLEKEAAAKAAGTEETKVKRGPGRPKGSKNKKTLEKERLAAMQPPKEKRGPGRPKGSKNKKTLEREALAAKQAKRMKKTLNPTTVSEQTKEKRGRGRPKGSKNKKTLEREALAAKRAKRIKTSQRNTAADPTSESGTAPH